MRDFIEKKKSRSKLFLIFYIVTIVLWLVSYSTIAFLPMPAPVTIIYIFTMAVLALSFGYFLGIFPFIRSLKMLEENNMTGIADDIILEKPTLPKSKIYCGQYAFFCKKPCVIIPYSEIAWVHLYRRTAYGVVTVEKAVIIYTKSGKKYSLNSDDNEFKWLLENIILRHVPDLILGFDSDRKKLYYQRNPKAMAKKVRGRIIGGSILIGIGVIFAILAVTIAVEVIPPLIFAGIFALIGTILILTRKL